MTALSVPTIHMNGTSRKSLIEGYIDAIEALDVALQKLMNANPNVRDYYTQGDGAFKKAVMEQRKRIEALQQVKKELTEIAEAIA